MKKIPKAPAGELEGSRGNREILSRGRLGKQGGRKLYAGTIKNILRRGRKGN